LEDNIEEDDIEYKKFLEDNMKMEWNATIEDEFKQHRNGQKAKFNRDI
jgi:hypothetical protein